METLVWCIANQPPLEMMQVTFWAEFNHDDLNQVLEITSVYPKGTKPQLSALLRFEIPPGEMVKQQVAAIVTPILGRKGTAWTGRIVLLDQFQRKHVTKKSTFRWAG